MLQLRLLGQFDMRAEGKRVVIPSRAGQSLLSFLVLNPGIDYRRGKLAGMFWAETSEENAHKALRQELWRIRKAISSVTRAEGEFLRADDISVSFNPDAPLWLDVAHSFSIW